MAGCCVGVAAVTIGIVVEIPCLMMWKQIYLALLCLPCAFIVLRCSLLSTNTSVILLAAAYECFLFKRIYLFNYRILPGILFFLIFKWLEEQDIRKRVKKRVKGYLTYLKSHGGFDGTRETWQ